MKKNSILALVLTVAMIFAVNVPVMAAEVTTTPAGGTLYLPPAGQMSSVELGLDVDGTPAEGVTSNITNNTAGVFKSGNSLILDGELTKAGSVTVNATAGGNTASSTMQVSPYILYEDFEDGTVGANVSTTKIEKLSASAEDKSMFASTSTALIAGDSNDRYSGATDVNLAANGLTVSDNENVTVIATLNMNISAHITTGFALFDSNNTRLVELKLYNANTNTYIWSRVSSTGQYSPNGVKPGADKSAGRSWATIRIELDFANKTYDVYLNDETTPFMDDWPIYNKSNSGATITNNATLGKITFGTDFDDVQVYSGSLYESEDTIIGTETIYAPKAGSFAKVDGYNVVDSEASAIENATITLADSYAGMQVRNNALLISNDVTAGKKTLIATDVNGDFLAKGVVNVDSDVYYEDFSDLATDATANTAKLEKLDGTASGNSIISTETPGVASGDNKYADAKSTAMTIDLGDGTVKGGKFTFSADVRVTGLKHGTEFLVLKDSIGTILARYTYINAASGERIKSRSDKDGGYVASGTDQGFTKWIDPPDGDWVNLRIEMNFDNSTYDFYVDNKLICDDWKIFNRGGTVTNNGTFKTATCNSEIDNIVVYSGTPYTIVADEARLTIPAAGESSTSITAKYNDGTAVSNLVCTTATAGVTGEGNQVKVSSEAAVAPVTVTLSDGFVTGTATFEVDKNYVLVNGAEYTGGTALNTGSNSIYAVYGASDMEAGNIIYIARYSKDGELISLENFAKSQTTATMIEATLTDSFGENDFAKVFVWDDGTLKPLKAAVEVK